MDSRAAAPPPIPFADQLAARAEDPERRKGERTRNRLKAVAAKLLVEVGYRELKVNDVIEAAGVSNALFYIYFKNKEEITAEILNEFLEVLGTQPRQAAKPATAEEAVYRGNLAYIRQFEANPGLMYCLLQFADEIPAFAGIWREFNLAWIERTHKSFALHGGAAFTSAEVFVASTALGIMTDALLRMLYVDKEPRLIGPLREVATDAPALALFLTRMWSRVVFARDLEWRPAEGG